MKLNPLSKLYNWLTNHLRAIVFALGEMIRHPFASLLTILVIAISLSLPFGLYRLINSLEPLGEQISTAPNIAVYVDRPLSHKEVNTYKTIISQVPGVEQITYTSPKQGLENFSKYAKLGEILKGIDKNPLPSVFTVIPRIDRQTPTQLSILTQHLKILPGISLVQLNMAWVKRLYYLITFSRRIIFALATIFSLGVFLIVGNTIRLITQHNQEDINIMRLFGAKASFIRRPLLYRGLLLGLFGGLLAWILVTLILSWLANPLQSLIETYQGSLTLHTFNGVYIVYMGLFGMGLAGLGAWFAVTPYLKQAID